MTKLERHLESTDLCQEANFSTYRDYTQNGNIEHPQNVSVPCPTFNISSKIHSKKYNVILLINRQNKCRQKHDLPRGLTFFLSSVL